MKKYFYLILFIGWNLILSSCSNSDIENELDENNRPNQTKSSTTADWRYIKGTAKAPRIVNFKDEMNSDKTINMELTENKYYYIQVKYYYPDKYNYDISTFNPIIQDFYTTDYQYNKMYPSGSSDPIRLNLKYLPKGKYIVFAARGVSNVFPKRYLGGNNEFEINSVEATEWSNPVQIYSNPYGFYEELGPKSVNLNRDFDESRLLHVTLKEPGIQYEYEITTVFYNEYNSTLQQDRISFSKESVNKYYNMFCEVPYGKDFSYVIEVKRYDTITKKRTKASYSKEAKADGDTYERIEHSVSLSDLQYTNQ